MRPSYAIGCSLAFALTLAPACRKSIPGFWGTFDFPTEGALEEVNSREESLSLAYAAPGTSRAKAQADDERFRLAAPRVRALGDAYKKQIERQGYRMVCDKFRVDWEEAGAQPKKVWWPTYYVFAEKEGREIGFHLFFLDESTPYLDGKIVVLADRRPTTFGEWKSLAGCAPAKSGAPL